MNLIHWLEMEIVKLESKFPIPHAVYELCEQAKEMERQQRMLDYTTGYNDGACNHVNDAEQYVDQTSRNK